MKPLLLTIWVFVSALSLCMAVEPVTDLKVFSRLKSNDKLYRWTVNIGNTGDVVFLCARQDYKDALHDGQMPSWTVYLPVNGGSDYRKLAGVKSTDGKSDFSDVAIHLDKMFIGPIRQLGRIGIVTAQIDRPRKGAPAAYIYAYTLEGDYMKQTLLATYDPDKRNAIYDQYLSDAHRTKLEPQEITP